MTPTSRIDTQFTILRQFQNLIGEANVTPGDDIESSLHHKLVQAIAPNQPLPCVVYPSTQEELATVVECAYQNRWTMMPMGNATKLHWGGLAQPIQVVVGTSRLNTVIDHAVGDLTLTVEAGASFQTVTELLSQTHQELGIDPSFTQEATLGGIVATGDSGSLRQRYGSVRDMVIGVSFVRSDGTIAKAGGRVVKNVAGYDLMKLMTGAYGTLGILSQLTFRLYPKAKTSKTVVLVGEADAMQTLVSKVLASSLTPHRFDACSPQFLSQFEFGEGVGSLVQFQSIPVSVEQQVVQLEEMAKTLSVRIVDILTGESEDSLWLGMKTRMEQPSKNCPITGKIGVLPDQVISSMMKFAEILPADVITQFHVSSGLGRIHFPGDAIAPQDVLPIRHWCEAHGGFLSILEAPPSWKEQLDIWGYRGNGLSIMEALKKQFDPYHLLSPGRFIGTI